MALLSDLLAKHQSSDDVFSSATWFAHVAAPAPATVDDLLYVIIPDIDPYLKWGPARWMPRVLTLPSVGDEALVVFDNRQQPWVIGIG